MNKALWLARILLVLHALTSIIYGLTLLADPAATAEFMGLQILNGDGTAELITMYVGMTSAVSLFMIYGAINTKWLPIALLYLVVSMSGITIGRLLAFFAFETGSYIQNALIYDIPVIVLAWFAYYQLEIKKDVGL